MAYNNYDYRQPPVPMVPQITSAWAIVSLIAGISSFMIFPLFGAILAIIGGSVAKKEIRNSGGRVSGNGMATWGLVLGWINIAISVIGLCIVILMIMGVFGAGGFAMCGPFSDMMNGYY
ncbi:MAG: DUF4190 domain-containing protein [Chloroflexota bacterium]